MTKQASGSAQIIPLRGVAGRPHLRRRRVEVMCVPCGRHFRYIYPGTGPYRSVCPQCKEGK